MAALPRKLLTRVLPPPWEPEKFDSPEAQNNNLANLLNWVRDYETRGDEYGLKRHLELFRSFDGEKVECLSVADYPAG